MKIIYMEAWPGEWIGDTCRRAVNLLAANPGDYIQFEFNDVIVVARPGDTADDICRRYDDVVYADVNEFAQSLNELESRHVAEHAEYWKLVEAGR